MGKNRRDRIREETLDEIKQIAKKQLAKSGAAGVSLRAIAREMGMSTPGLYSYFANYDELISTLMLDAFTSLADTLETARDDYAATDHSGRFQGVVDAYRQWALDHRFEYLLIFGTPNINASSKEVYSAAKKNWHIVAGVLSAAAEAGVIHIPTLLDEPPAVYLQIQQEWRTQYGIDVSVPILHTAVKVWGLFHGLVMLELTHHKPELPKQAHQTELKLLMRELGLQ